MVSIRFKYVIEDTDRHGNVRLYFRRKGQPKIRLRGMPGSEQFKEAYQAALTSTGEAKQQREKIRTSVGSFGYVCLNYFASPTFKALDPATQKQRRYFLDSICVKHGDKPIALMEPRHIERLLEEKRNTPAAARNRLKALQALFLWAMKNKKATHNPTRGVKPIPYSTKGHHTWTAEEVVQFEQRHPVGTSARLAMTLMLYTGCRREDVVRLGPQHIKNGRLRYTQAKNEHRNPVDIDIPVHPDLAKAIAAASSGHMTFLATAYGKPFTAAGFGNKFREWCNAADLPQCSSHGLRKATATRLAERGASSQEIMSITGHRSLSEVERYTRAADKPKLADSGMAKFGSSNEEH
jgi:integrase/recombinase XerD